MVASVAVSFLSLLLFASVGAMLTCESESNGNVSEIWQLSGGGCMYILEKETVDSRDVYEDECRSLNNETDEWHLPMLKTKEKHDEVEKLLEITVQKKSWFWIGVIRENGTEEWRDLTKWIWSLDNTTVAESIGNFTPWNETTNGDESDVPEHCAFVQYEGTGSQRGLLWEDAPCSEGSIVTEGYGIPLLLCESSGVSTSSSSANSSTTSSTKTSTTTTSSTTTTTTATTTTTPATTTLPATTTTTTTTMPATTTATTTMKKTRSTSTPSTTEAPKQFKPWQIGVAVLLAVDVTFMIAVTVICICTAKAPRYKSLDDTPKIQPDRGHRMESRLSPPAKPAVKKSKLKGKKV